MFIFSSVKKLNLPLQNTRGLLIYGHSCGPRELWVYEHSEFSVLNI